MTSSTKIIRAILSYLVRDYIDLALDPAGRRRFKLWINRLFQPLVYRLAYMRLFYLLKKPEGANAG